MSMDCGGSAADTLADLSVRGSLEMMVFLAQLLSDDER